MSEYYTYEEAMDKIEQFLSDKPRRHKIYEHELEMLFPGKIRFIEDFEEAMMYSYGMYYLKIKNSYLIFPLDEDKDIMISTMKKIDEKTLKELTKALDEYKKIKLRLEISMKGIDELLDSQKLRTLFKKEG